MVTTTSASRAIPRARSGWQSSMSGHFCPRHSSAVTETAAELGTDQPVVDLLVEPIQPLADRWRPAPQ